MSKYKDFLSGLKIGELVAVCYDDSDNNAMPGFVKEIDGEKIIINTIDYFSGETLDRLFINGKFEVKSWIFHVLGKSIMDVYNLKEATPLATFLTRNLNPILHTAECEVMKSLTRCKCTCEYKERNLAANLAINETFK